MRRLAAIAAALVVGSVVAVVGLAWLAARSLVMPRRRPLAGTPADVGLAFETLELTGADGIRLAAWWIAAERPRATAVLVHGFRSTRTEMLAHAPYLCAAGFDVLLFDTRACGLSGGAMSTMGWREQDDLRVVIDQVAARSPGRPIVVMGHSLGAATVILEGADDERVAAFVLEAPFTAIDDVVGRGFRHFTRPHLPAFPFAPLAVRLAERRVGQRHTVVRPIDAIGHLAPRPVLLVTGGADAFVTAADGRRLAEQAGASATWWFIPEAEHPGGSSEPFALHADEYRRRVLQLFDAVLPVSDPAPTGASPASVVSERASIADAAGPFPSTPAPRPPTTGSSVA